MGNFNKLIIFSVLVVMLVVSSGFNNVAQAESNFAVGFQYTYPFSGFCVALNLGDTIGAQGILGFGSIGGKGIFRFIQEDFWNVFAFGGGGIVGFGAPRFAAVAGAGFEYDWGQFLRSLDFEIHEFFRDRSIKTNIELGMRFFTGWGGAGIFIGYGTHYYF